MLIENSFRVPVPVEQAWRTLLDVPRIAPCLPGATLDESEGTTHRGRVKVKVGPIQLAYKGEATIAEQDEVARRLVLVATGRETRGSGAASARVVAELVERDGATDVQVATDLDLTGKPAQFGRSIISDVSGRLIDQFATNLAALMVAPQASPTAEPAVAPTSGPPPSPAAPAPPGEGAALDVWTLLPPPVRVGVRVVLPALLLLATGWLLGRRGR
ncbi:SRPBCC family protein [Blastococcus sp. PRF04-17]|uniref:SRPBCC family protein n=1 Tax=Blastococcus sp. PRF04-17 TaxID=2933797 RepID=UPI001FF29DEF|nr:SRPBCC family protein [Blastococcus sp. PRF04-17]UOY02243.1 SRPBCC family protein [Blastococcus sp. PRF04-17]